MYVCTYVCMYVCITSPCYACIDEGGPCVACFVDGWGCFKLDESHPHPSHTYIIKARPSLILYPTGHGPRFHPVKGFLAVSRFVAKKEEKNTPPLFPKKNGYPSNYQSTHHFYRWIGL